MMILQNIDCIEGMRQLEDEAIDVVVTSPPYNLGIQYGTYKDTLSHQQYLQWCAAWGCEIARVLDRDGSFFLNVGSKPSDPCFPYDVLDVMRGVFHCQNIIHWVKSIAVGDEPARGHVKPINSDRYLNGCHEYIFHLTKTGNVRVNKLANGVPYADESNLTRGTRGKNGNLRDRGNVWFIPYETIQNREKDRPHPATFPVTLPLWCLKLHGLSRVEAVLDPFCGIGSTGLAAQQCCVPDFYGFDIDADYINEARRLLNVQGCGARGLDCPERPAAVHGGGDRTPLHPGADQDAPGAVRERGE